VQRALEVPILVDVIEKWTILHTAIAHNNVELIESLLKDGMDVNSQNLALWTPLHEAAYRDRPAIVRRLLEAGADPNKQTDTGWTPLHYACSDACHGPEVARLLLDYGADPTAVEKDGYIPFDLAVALPAWYSSRGALLDLFRERFPELVFERYCAPAPGP